MSELLLAKDLIPDRALSEGDLDAFNHEAIAGRVAEIVLHAPTPANVALFGAWGSGKSSVFELLRRVLDSRSKAPVALVRYDAWKYGGASLKRNFISHAATELGLGDADSQNREFHRGLYESTRSLDLRFSQYLKGEVGRVVKASALTVAITLALVVIFAVIVGWLTQQGIWATVATWAGTWGATVAGALGTLVAVLKLLDLAKVEVEQTAPSADEQFSKTFTRLVSAARERGNAGKFERLVFFIDELDRCSKSDVVETLSALRTFLDMPRCVFIVVADRDVLEEALTELPQSTPSNEDSPYYSTASAFLDKVFQFQIALPPLRVGRLTRFARDLVIGRGGIWDELTSGGAEHLNEVVYALIPSHVRSPRRIKVLLNRFATNSRVAQARGLDWQARAAEIAKLTVLQTEFPIFADALLLEPRLPEFVRARQEPDPLPQRTRAVIHRFVTAARAATQDEDRLDGSEGALDHVLTTPAQSPAIHRAQQRQLVRYLERTAKVPNPGRDLLYLEAAGASTGLDPTIGQVLEDLAPESPERALEVTSDLEDAERQSAVMFLAEMTDREFGVERANVLDVALGTADALEDRPREALRPLAHSVGAFLQEQPIEERQLTSALAVALAAQETGLIKILMADDRLLADPARVETVAAHLPALPPEHQGDVAEKIAQFLQDSPSVLLSPLKMLPKTETDWLLGEINDAVIRYVNAVEDAGGPEEADNFLADLLGSSSSRVAVLSLIWRLLLLKKNPAYRFLKLNPALIASLPKQRRNSYALMAILHGPPSDWALWGEMIEPSDQGWVDQSQRAKRVLVRLVQELPQLDDSEKDAAIEIARRAAPITVAADAEVAEEIGKALQTSLGARAWWIKPAWVKIQASIHSIASDMTAAGELVENAIQDAREQDLIRALANPTQVTPHTLLALPDVSQGLRPESLIEVVNRLETIETAVPADARSDAARARILIWARLTKENRGKTSPVKAEDVITALDDFADGRLEVLRVWLRTEPARGQALAVALAVPLSAERKTARLFAEWAKELNVERRTEFLKALWQNDKTGESWVRHLQPLGLNELELVELLIDEVGTATRADQREEIVDRILALSPRDGRAQYRVGDLVVQLLNTGYKVDAQLALRVVPALGSGHRSKGRIEDALKQVSEELGVRITSVQAKSLKAVGINPPKRSFTERAWTFFTGGS